MCLDTGFQKAMSHVTGWFTKMSKLPSFISAFGCVKLAQKPLKPANLLVKEKKAAPAKVEKAVKKEETKVEAKPAKNPLELLPETKFDLFNFKTFFVNVKD